EDGDSFVKTEVINALSNMGVEIKQLDQLIDDEERSVRLAAAEALVAFEGEAALDRIVDFAFAKEGYNRLEAAKLLRRIGVQKANPPLIAVIEDENRRREWQVAIEVLGVINSGNNAQ
ncbi:MAG: HEAT repeat domain-containing protein, partial [Rhodospirillaceae bacterium]|nr:HEAT repeat domain-containing protein [Rhodospirillaceae bacterium]